MKTNKLKIGSQVYKLKAKGALLQEQSVLGLCFKDISEIHYSELKPPDVIADTILHEVLHAIVHNYLYDIEEEEEIVTQMAHGLVQVMRDNPKFFDELRAML